MKPLILTGLIFILFSGCKQGVPKELIQPDQMGKILIDIHLVDSYVNTIPNVDSSKIIAAAYYKGIYKKFEVDSSLYSRSMIFYSANPEIFNKIYEKVTAELTKEKTILVKADSVVNAKLAKKAMLKARTDSVKLADSIKKTSGFKKTVLRKKADSIHKADSLAKLNQFKKARTKTKPKSLTLKPFKKSIN